VREYTADGTLAQRIQTARQLGNHKTNPRLIWNLRQKLLKAQGKSDVEIAALMGNAPPLDWQGGLPASGSPRHSCCSWTFRTTRTWQYTPRRM